MSIQPITPDNEMIDDFPKLKINFKDNLDR